MGHTQMTPKEMLNDIRNDPFVFPGGYQKVLIHRGSIYCSTCAGHRTDELPSHPEDHPESFTALTVNYGDTTECDHCGGTIPSEWQDD